MKKTTKWLMTLMLILGVGCILEGCGKESNHSVTITLIHAWGGTEEADPRSTLPLGPAV